MASKSNDNIKFHGKHGQSIVYWMSFQNKKSQHRCSLQVPPNYIATCEIVGSPMCTRRYCPTVSSTVSILSVSLSCWSNMIPDTSDNSLSVIAPLSAMDTSELAPNISPEFLKLILSKLRSSSMQCLTGCMRKLIMSQRTLLGRSTAGCTILYLTNEMKPKKLPSSMLFYSFIGGVDGVGLCMGGVSSLMSWADERDSLQ